MGSPELAKEDARVAFKIPSRMGTRSTRACCRCRSRKVRCIFETPHSRCNACHMHDTKCTFDPEPKTLNGTGNPASSDSPETVIPDGIIKSMSECPETSRSPDSEVSTSQTSSLPQKPTGDWVSGHMDHIYPFIEVSNISSIPKEDLQLLESRGCFDIPTRHILDIMIEEYFLRIHPLLPIVNEASFWRMYQTSSGGEQPPSTAKVSLLLLQAIMAVSCSFVPTSALGLLGFKTTLEAQATFFKRAKLLYNFNSEKHSITMSQATLLLSQTQLTDKGGVCDKSGSMWLTLAIHHARKAGAQRYHSAQMSREFQTEQSRALQNSLKRLWWSCILSDRVLSLASRQSIQITPSNFDFDHNPPLDMSDMAEEIHSSQVYDVTTKSSLIEILMKLLELSIVLTDVLMMAFPTSEGIGQPTQRQITTCRLYLRGWRSTMRRHQPEESHDHEECKNLETSQKSIILFTKLIDIYYYSAIVVLCHHELFWRWKTAASSFPESTSNGNPEKFHELKHALSQISERLSELMELRIVKWLPISALGCTAFPIVLKLLEAKFLSAKSDGGSEFRKLHNLVGAMMVYCSQYECANWVAHAIRSTVHTFSSCPSTSDVPKTYNQSKTNNYWADTLRQNPLFYLHLAMALDLCISNGRLSNENDLPNNIHFRFESRDLELRNQVQHQNENIRPVKRRNIDTDRTTQTWDQNILFGINTEEETTLTSLSDGVDGEYGIELDDIFHSHLGGINLTDYDCKAEFSNESHGVAAFEESGNADDVIQKVLDEIESRPEMKVSELLALAIS